MEAIYNERAEAIENIIGRLMTGEMKLSYTALSNFISSPKDFIDYKLQKKEETDAMIYGSMLHCLILEPHDFDNRYFAFDDSQKCNELIAGGAKSPRATKIYKEWKAEKCAGAGTRMIVAPQEYQHAKGVAANVTHNRASRKVMDLAPRHELAIDWDFLNFGWHGFIDGDGDEDMFDIKSMQDASPKKVEREIVSGKLYLQAAMYQFGIGKQKNYHIIAVDKTGGVSVHKIHEKLIEQGVTEYNNYVKKFNHCILTEAWDQSFDFWAERWDGIFVTEKPGFMY